MKPTCSRRSLASSSGPAPSVERPPTRTVPRVGVSMHPRIDSSVVLPLPDGPISSVNSPPLSARLTPLSACTWRRPVAEEFHDIDGLDDGFGHRVNTIAGSMRVTCTIAAIADIDAHDDRQHEQAQRQSRAS